MNKNIWIVVILGLVIIVLLGILVFLPVKHTTPQAVSGIEVISPKVNEEISSPIKITGVVNGEGWAGFEGQVGTVKLMDYKGNQIATGVLLATTDWTNSQVSFATTLTFQSKTIGPMNLIFINENPSGDPVRDKVFNLPVKIK